MTTTQPVRFIDDVRATRVVFAPGAVRDVGDELHKLSAKRALVISTRGRLASLPPLDQLLGDTVVGVFDAAVEHVPVATVADARAELDRVSADVCVTIGGGSAIGLGKILARDAGVTLVAVPTTYSGSEMTSIWGITDANGKKTGRDPRVAPRVVVYDPDLTLDLPTAVSAASGMNAMAHAVEALYAANASPMALAIAEEAARLLYESLPRVVAAPSDRDARAMVLAGAYLAGRSLDLAAMGLHHRLCHVLGGSFGLPHARTHAALLPHVLAFNAPAAPAAIERLSRAFSHDDPVAAIANLARTLGVAVPLSSLGLRAEHLDRVADEALATPYGNPRPAVRNDVRRVLTAAVRGEL